MDAKLALVSVMTVWAATVPFVVPLHAADLNTPYAAVSTPQLLYAWKKFEMGSSFGGPLGTENEFPPLDSFSTDPSGVLGGTQRGQNDLFSPNWLLPLGSNN